MYAAAGNRLEAAEKLAVEVDEVVNTYTYDAANRQTGANGVAYTWGANGRGAPRSAAEGAIC